VQMRRDARHLHDIAHILTACEDAPCVMPDASVTWV
jgi:hypothetical protein